MESKNEHARRKACGYRRKDLLTAYRKGIYEHVTKSENDLLSNKTSNDQHLTKRSDVCKSNSAETLLCCDHKNEHQQFLPQKSSRLLRSRNNKDDMQINADNFSSGKFLNESQRLDNSLFSDDANEINSQVSNSLDNQTFKTMLNKIKDANAIQGPRYVKVPVINVLGDEDQHYAKAPQGHNAGGDDPELPASNLFNNNYTEKRRPDADDNIFEGFLSGKREDFLDHECKQQARSNVRRWDEYRSNVTCTGKNKPSCLQLSECRCLNRSKEKVHSWLFDERNKDESMEDFSCVTKGPKTPSHHHHKLSAIQMTTIGKPTVPSFRKAHNEQLLNIPTEKCIESQRSIIETVSAEPSSYNLGCSIGVSSLNNTAKSSYNLESHMVDKRMRQPASEKGQTTQDDIQELRYKRAKSSGCSAENITKDDCSLYELLPSRSYSMKTLRTDIKERLPLVGLSCGVLSNSQIFTIIRKTGAGLEIENRACKKPYYSTKPVSDKLMNLEELCSLPQVKHRTINWVENQRLLHSRVKV
eukprot:gene12935-3692_t